MFEMKDSRLEEVSNPSELFLAEGSQCITGSAVVEIQCGARARSKCGA